MQICNVDSSRNYSFLNIQSQSDTPDLASDILPRISDKVSPKHQQLTGTSREPEELGSQTGVGWWIVLCTVGGVVGCTVGWVVTCE